MRPHHIQAANGRKGVATALLFLQHVIVRLMLEALRSQRWLEVGSQKRHAVELVAQNRSSRREEAPSKLVKEGVRRRPTSEGS